LSTYAGVESLKLDENVTCTLIMLSAIRKEFNTGVLSKSWNSSSTILWQETIKKNKATYKTVIQDFIDILIKILSPYQL